VAIIFYYVHLYFLPFQQLAKNILQKDYKLIRALTQMPENKRK
jgi:hypothetical protein